MTFLEAVVQLAHQLGEFVQDPDGSGKWLYQPVEINGNGKIAANELRAIADELDRLNGITEIPS